MASKWNSEYNLPPPTYSSLYNEEKCQEGWTFIDFYPEIIKSGGIFKKPTSKNFRTLVDRANDWLRGNPQWEIKTVESVEFPVDGNIIHSEKMIYFEQGDVQNIYIVGLRLWICSKKDDKKVQQIGYLNVIPEEIKPGGIFKSPTYEKLDDVVNKFNQKIRYQPIPGPIISIETQKMTVIARGVNPEKTRWTKYNNVSQNFLYVLRIFYEITEATYEEIGFQDFLPSVMSKGGVFSLPKHEMFCYVVRKASEWCSRQIDLRIFNVQSIDMKVEGGNEIDTKKMFYEEYFDQIGFLRVLRVAYTKSVTNSKLYPILSSIPQLAYKTFVPLKVSGLVTPDLETLQQTKARISAWIKATGAKVINAETLCVNFNFMGSGPSYFDDITYTLANRKEGQYWVHVLRIYLDRHYPEPPQGTLPPVPVIQKSNCLIF